MPAPAHQTLPFGPVHNVGLFSSHWLEHRLEHRLELEPEWRELRDEAGDVLQRLAELWKVERNRVECYGSEQIHCPPSSRLLGKVMTAGFFDEELKMPAKGK